MTVQEKPYPVVSLAVDTFGEWLTHRRELKEMREMDAASFGQIASELRMSSADLEALVRRGPHSADELPKMLTALGIDQQDLARTEPLVLRDMERVCSLCTHKRQCDRDLAAGTAAAHYEEYCGNADTIDGLGQRSFRGVGSSFSPCGRRWHRRPSAAVLRKGRRCFASAMDAKRQRDG